MEKLYFSSILDFGEKHLIKKVFNLPFVFCPHTHGRDLEQEHVTTIFQTMLEALLSGVGIVCLMPNTTPPIDNIKTLKKVIRLIENAEKLLNYRVKAYVWVALTDTNHDEVIKMLLHDRVIGTKVYPLKDDGTSATTGAVGIKKWESVDLLLQIMERMNGVGNWKNKPIAGHWTIPSMGHTETSEYIASCVLADIARKYPFAKFVACHMSTQRGIEVISRAQDDGLQIVIELTPHHLFFANHEVDIKNGIFMCYPPIRGSIDRDFCIKFLSKNRSNPLVWLGSDTANHLLKDKKKKNPPRGLATLQHILPVLLTINEETCMGLSEKDIGNLTCFNAANFLGVTAPKGKAVWERDPYIDDISYNNGLVANPFKGYTFNYRIR